MKIGLYKNCDKALSTDIEAQREVVQYFTVDDDTNSGAGRDYIMPHQFAGSKLGQQINRGYVINDSATGTLYIKFKFTLDHANESFTEGVEVLPGKKFPLYLYPLISVIRVENVPVNPGENLLFRIFAT